MDADPLREKTVVAWSRSPRVQLGSGRWMVSFGTFGADAPFQHKVREVRAKVGAEGLIARYPWAAQFALERATSFEVQEPGPPGLLWFAAFSRY
jgi:hypothetical protein